MATYDPTVPLTVTLPEGRWRSIRAAVLCLASDESVKGNHKESAHYLRAFNDLKAAMGD
jgi:hypothetical protein